MDLSFYKNKKVLITGHTGFKGAWMCKALLNAGAIVIGYSIDVPSQPALFDIMKLDQHTNLISVEGDIRDLSHLQSVFSDFQPEIVIHMAAQPIVRESYKNPVYTYETNVIGTVNILECVRLNMLSTGTVRSVVNVTTDKVYLNREWDWGYRENEELCGYDPYSNSKSCSELVTYSYINSFFSSESAPAISTCRAGNVIGGGDFAIDRIIPDCYRATSNGQSIVVRNPYSTRPYQHVLEPVMAYLMVAEKQYFDKKYAGSYNVGPGETDCWTTGSLVNLFCDVWNRKDSEIKATWVDQSDGGPHEANFLKLDCSKIKALFAWEPRWDVKCAMELIVDWYRAYLKEEDIIGVMDSQIKEYLE